MREEKNKLFSKKNMVSLFIVFIMVSSVIGFMYGGSSQKERYNDFLFGLEGNQWVTEVNDKKYGFDSFPTEVEFIEVDSSIINRMKNTLEIDTTYDLDDSNVEAISLAQYSLSQTLNVYIRNGATTENEFNLPVISCKDATNAVLVIYFQSSNQTKISSQGSCVIAESRNAVDFIRIKDRLLYGILGVIE